ncbi:hypothetical protein ASD42_02325 [Nocardia sp. Root136]|nr:hypothetical protein ASD42_02325 [Nocardia sp. Root136]
MRFTVPTIVSMMAAVLLTGCSLFPQGPDQAERISAPVSAADTRVQVYAAFASTSMPRPK